MATIATRNKGQKLMDFPDNYTVIDIETTGLSASKNEIIELSALKIRDNEIFDSYTTLVRPLSRIGGFITKLTGISDEMVENAPLIEEILEEYLNFIGDDVVVGHNVNFDINFIYDKSVKYYNREFRNDFVDTCTMSRKYCPTRSHKLDYVAEYYKVDATGHHRADNDCRMTYGIYSAMKKQVQSEV